ncbi:MAG: universal stress protein [Caldilineaceae bacterium]|nr:universal stress protein [Caldilineaceae bacterium]
MRRILIPLNVSEISLEILSVVRQLFSPSEAELILLGITQRPDHSMTVDAYVGDVPHSTYLVPCTDEEWHHYRQRFEIELKALANTLRAAGYRVHTIVRVGEPVAQILAAVENGIYDLIAMATRGRTGLSRLLLGSVAENVLRQSPIPLLLMRADPAAGAKQRTTQEQATLEKLAYEPSLAHAL